MITVALLNGIFSLVDLIVDIFPNIDNILDTIQVMPELVHFIRIGLYFTGGTWLFTTFSVFSTWYTLLLGWSIVEWVYKKIPGVE